MSNIFPKAGRIAFNLKVGELRGALANVAESNHPGISYFQSLKLVEDGLCERFPVHTGKRGQPKQMFKLTPKGVEHLEMLRQVAPAKELTERERQLEMLRLVESTGKTGLTDELSMRFMNQGYIAFSHVEGGALRFKVARKGANLLRLSANWGKHTANLAVPIKEAA